MAKNVIYALGLLFMIAFGLFMELGNGDYLMIEKLIANKPPQVAVQK